MAIAIRNGVVGSGTSTLHFMHGDQLGSVTALTTISGGLVSGSISRFYPFGGYRTTPTTNPGTTDQGYTGHKHNDSIGLIYMNARYYVSSIGRFASADSIVPSPENPQSYNRFTYVLNNPLRFTDPTGHCSEDAQLGEVLLCVTIDSLESATSLLEAMDAYLYLYERDYIGFLEAIGLADLSEAALGELSEKALTALILAAVPGIGKAQAAWIAVFLVAGILSSEGEHNAHVALYHFRDLLEQAINDWQDSGRDDLFMEITVYDAWLENPIIFMEVRSGYYRNESGLITYDQIFYDWHPTEGWGNDFSSLLEDLLVIVHDEIGFGFVKITYWNAYIYDGTGYMEIYPYREFQWFYQ